MSNAPRRLALPVVALTLGIVLVGATISPRPIESPAADLAPTAGPPTPSIAALAATPSPTAFVTASPSPTASPTPSPLPTATRKPTPKPTPRPTAARKKTVVSAPKAVVRTTPRPTAAPKRTLASTGIYGSAFAMDSKNNVEVGASGNQRVAHRFRASTTSSLTAIAINQRGGPGYSSGNGGTIKVSLQTSSAGKPSGKTLASLTITPGNASGNWERQTTYRFPSPAKLTRGQLYHIVFANTSASPGSNYISLNEAFTYAASAPRQPVFSDDFAVLSVRGGSWAAHSHDTPVMDLTYANGVHDGNAYSSVIADHYGIASGAKAVGERFTVHGSSRTVSTASVRLKRIRGSGTIKFRLEKSNGTLVASGTVSSTKIPISPLPVPVSGSHWDETSLGGGRWAKVSFGKSVVLRSGTTYVLKVSTDSSTTLAAVPVREQDDTTPHWRSRAFRDGYAYVTTGSGWHALYAYGAADLQFYLR